MGTHTHTYTQSDLFYLCIPVAKSSLIPCPLNSRKEHKKKLPQGRLLCPLQPMHSHSHNSLQATSSELACVCVCVLEEMLSNQDYLLLQECRACHFAVDKRPRFLRLIFPLLNAGTPWSSERRRVVRFRSGSFSRPFNFIRL